MLTAVWAILIFCALIFIHEFGHFITAKLSGMTVHEFAIGMGPKLFGFSKNNTQYTVRILPIGGFVRLEGEDGDSSDPGAFCNKSALKRFVVLFAGAFMNILLGFLIFTLVISTADGFASNEIDFIAENSAFEKAGIAKGDRIVRMEGENYSTGVHFYQDIYLFTMLSGNSKATITFERNNERFEKTITPIFDETAGKALFGFKPRFVNPGFFATVSYAFWECIYVIKSVFLSLWWLVTGGVSVSEMSGPVGIVREIGSAAKAGWQYVLDFAGLISVNLGVMNLLPVPALDGGRILFLLIEKIRGKKMNPETEGKINLIFLGLLLLFMLFVTFSDVMKIFG